MKDNDSCKMGNKYGDSHDCSNYRLRKFSGQRKSRENQGGTQEFPWAVETELRLQQADITTVYGTEYQRGKCCPEVKLRRLVEGPLEYPAESSDQYMP